MKPLCYAVYGFFKKGGPVIALKLLITLLFLALMGVLAAVVSLGGSVAHATSIYLKPHRRLANAAFWLALTAVIFTEIFVRLNGGVRNQTLFWVHLACALPFFLSLGTLRFWLTGIKNPRIHKPVAYLCIFSFAGTLITGLILLWQY